MACDQSYEKYVKPCINSIEKNWVNHPEILMFATGLNKDFEEWLINKNIKIIKKDININFKNLGPVNNKIVYKKYICWDYETFKDYDNVLHLDCDTLILKSVDDIINSNEFMCYDDNEILGQKNRLFKFEDNNLNKLLKKYNITNTVMCNAGVFLIPKNYRTKENYDLLISLTNEFEKYIKYADQSIISLFCHILNISIHNNVYYNFQPHFLNYKDRNYDFNEIKILHFAAVKPDTIHFQVWWRLNGISEKFYNLWNSYNNI
jgi:hypothetical protein